MMSLNEKQVKFLKQQERCLSTTIASSSSSRASRPPESKTISSTRPALAAPVRFSDDTRRLQHILNIRKSCASAQIKLVIDLLFKTREAFTAEQIKEACHVDLHANKEVFNSLRNNPKTYFDGRRFSYKATHNVNNKSQLHSLVKKYPDGIPMNDLKDAYPNVLEDLQALKSSGDIWLLSNSKEYIAYPNDFKNEIKVDDGFKALFRDIQVPTNMLEVEKELRKIGLKPATNTAEREAAAMMHGISNKPREKKKKKQEISKRTKVTNFHLPELFEN